MKRWDVINSFIRGNKYEHYLEIGVRRGANFAKIECITKTGVDPDKESAAAHKITSDEFFNTNKEQFDIIFIDGLHLRDQVLKDISNSLNVLYDNGSIIIHDCNPPSQFEAREIYKTEKFYKRGDYKLRPDGEFGHYPPWNGTVWEAWMCLRGEREDLEMFVIDTDNGCGVIRKGTQQPIKLPESLTFDFLSNNRESSLNLIKIDKLSELINKRS